MKNISFTLIVASLAICGCGQSKPDFKATGGTMMDYAFAKKNVTGDELEQTRSVLEQRLESTVASVEVGPRQTIRVLVPDVDGADVSQIRKLVEFGGYLEFRVLAINMFHDDVFEMAIAPENHGKSVIRGMDGDDVVYAKWVRVGRVSTPKKVAPVTAPDGKSLRAIYSVMAKGVGDNVYLLRDADTKEILGPRPVEISSDDDGLEKWLLKQGVQDIEVLIYMDDGYDVTGNYLSSVRAGFDQRGTPNVAFELNSSGAKRMTGLTKEAVKNRDQHGRSYDLGIILDDELLAAPRIQGVIGSQGQIVGNFSQQQIDMIVAILKAGQLPVPLSEAPPRIEKVSPQTK